MSSDLACAGDPLAPNARTDACPDVPAAPCGQVGHLVGLHINPVPTGPITGALRKAHVAVRRWCPPASGSWRSAGEHQAELNQS